MTPKKKRQPTEAEVNRRKAKSDVLDAVSSLPSEMHVIAARARVPEPLALDILCELAARGRVVVVDMKFRRPATTKRGAVHLRSLDRAKAPFCGSQSNESTRHVDDVTCSDCLARLAKYPQARGAYAKAAEAVAS